MCGALVGKRCNGGVSSGHASGSAQQWCRKPEVQQRVRVLMRKQVLP